MLTGWRRERAIRRVLKRLARRRVVKILQPGNGWLIEHAVTEDEEGVAEALRTCDMRGWVEVVEDAVPHRTVDASGALSDDLAGVAPIYRLTDAGWQQIRRTHTWVLFTFAVALLTLLATIVALLLARHS